MIKMVSPQLNLNNVNLNPKDNSSNFARYQMLLVHLRFVLE